MCGPMNTTDAEVTTSRPPAQLVFLVILAALHIVGGLVMVGVFVYYTFVSSETIDPPPGFSGLLITLAAPFYAVLGLTSGFGMLFGRHWGWWAGAFYYWYKIACGASALLYLALIHGTLPEGERGVGHYVVKIGGRIVIHLLILWYLYSASVLAYFGMVDRPRASLTLRLIGAVGIVGGIGALLNLVG